LFKNFFELISQKKVWQRIGLLAVLGIAVHLILPQITALENSWQVLTKMSLWLVGLAFIAQALSYLGSGYLLQMTLAIAHEAVSLLRSTLIVLGAASIAMVAGGTVGSSAAIYSWTSNAEGSVEGATLASILPSLFNNLMLVLLSIFGLVHLILVHNLTQAQLIGFSAALFTLGLLIGVCLLAVRYREQATAAVIRISSYVARLLHRSYDPGLTRKDMDNIFTAWDALWQGEWHLLALGASLNVAFDMLTLYFLFVASGNSISFGALLSGYGLPQLLGKMAFIIPGGVGVVESSMAALYNGLGVPNAATVVVVLGYRLISFWIPSISGFPIAAYLQSAQKRNHPKELSHDPAR
jgi:uncharacterized protein (TIRG00374 family)